MAILKSTWVWYNKSHTMQIDFIFPDSFLLEVTCSLPSWLAELEEEKKAYLGCFLPHT